VPPCCNTSRHSST